MNSLISICGNADVAYRRVCAILMLIVLVGFSLTIGGSALDLVMIRNVGLGIFLVAASSLLAVVVIAHRSEYRP